MNIKHYLYRVRSVPPHLIIKKLVGRAQRRLKLLVKRQNDTLSSTYIPAAYCPTGSLYRYFHPVPLEQLRSHADQILPLAQHYLEHRFDLLGSGWVQIKYGMHCRGLEGYRYPMGSPVESDNQGNWLSDQINRANLSESQRIWRLVTPDYTPIDWQLDFKSGYRWSQTTWYADILYGHQLGVDVKVPWELARMQHLPQLAWAYALARETPIDSSSHLAYVQEFRNQVLDFIATNPPRYGVNWHCTMDVGIRVVNWLVTYDLFQAYGAEFDPEFETEFQRSIYQHGLHIIHNLEWSPELRSNHYLANIAGLLFVAAYLPRTWETDTWLAFAVQELITEVNCQFYPDGANFEASTSYHRLSAEMVIYSTALVLGLPPEKQAALVEYNHRQHNVHPPLQPSPVPLYPLPTQEQAFTPFPTWYTEQLEKMAEFTMHITKPNGHIPQIGDNDSGRFLKLQPLYHRLTVEQAKAKYVNLQEYVDLPNEMTYWDEEHLDHRHLVAAINGLFGREDFTAFVGDKYIETQLIQNLAAGNHLTSYWQPGKLTSAETVRLGNSTDLRQLTEELESLPEPQRQKTKIPLPGNILCSKLQLYAYPDFGLYLYRSQRLYLAIRCGSVGQKGNGGHAHNDQLAIELNIDGEDWITDPGTYLYTPLPERRNSYRSIKAHSAPQVDRQEPGSLNLGLFSLCNAPKVECIHYGQDVFLGRYFNQDFQMYRMLILKSDGLIILDCCKNNASLNKEKNIYLSSTSNIFIDCSTGYGKILNKSTGKTY